MKAMGEKVDSGVAIFFQVEITQRKFSFQIISLEHFSLENSVRKSSLNEKNEFETCAPRFLHKFAENSSKRATCVEIRGELESISPLLRLWQLTIYQRAKAAHEKHKR